LTVRRRTAPHARQMGQMTAGGVAMQNLPQEELYGSDRRAHAVAPPALSNLATHCEDGVGLQPCGPLACETLKDGGDTRDPGVTSCTMGVLIPIHTGDARRIPPSTRPHEIDHEFCLTSCHSGLVQNCAVLAMWPSRDASLAPLHKPWAHTGPLKGRLNQ
jgi:hypothetical protein